MMDDLPFEERSMDANNLLDDLARRLADAVPPSLRNLGRDLESNFKAILQAQLAKLDLVTRSEFDVQAALLSRTAASLAGLEERLKVLEAKILGADGPPEATRPPDATRPGDTAPT
jgi:BMFP domain-containing protein YqiC